ncbi:MAG: DUF998 domain-containing protein [Candidatus Dormiibacterota bacterium]
MGQSTSTISRPAGAPGVQSVGSATRATRRALWFGAAAGPCFVLVAVIEIATRPGFNLTHQALSLLTNGNLGWVQSGNFIITGALFVAGAVGVRRVLRGGRAGTWAPILMTAIGIGLIGGGIFHPDPSNGFPPGAPTGNTAVSSWHGVLHLVFGSVAFLSLSLACFVFARRYSGRSERGLQIASIVAGIACAVGIMSGGAPGGTVSFFIGGIVGMLCVSLAAARLLAETRGA